MTLELLIGILLFVFIIGTVIGSFLNVVALRGLTGESIVLPPSKCPKCGNKLKPWHNIPILSYLFLRGKCAFCKEKISAQYPIVELLTGVLLLACLYKFSVSITAGFIFAGLCTLLVMSVTDIREKVICAGHAWFLIILGLAYNSVLSYLSYREQVQTTGFIYEFETYANLPITSAIIGLIAGIIIMEVLARLGYLFVGKRAFGIGDTYIAAGIGALLGWANLLTILGLSIAVQIAIVAPGFFKKLAAKHDYKTITALVTFLIAAAAFSASNAAGLLENFALCIAASVVLFIIGIYACVRIIKGIKDDGDIMVLPFGPAMAIATIITMFFIA